MSDFISKIFSFGCSDYPQDILSQLGFDPLEREF
ncbi:hypothetical protein Anas_09791 [Armadillidium nasatum]|uniref:Uncharacterized protein n=1 Tax=Armadillidium nasatum TaxID=96803 RepID=A0A5N5T950_9CRUS|nr:hypothetical protein Anas_09791 [Armadillidium nasatum]